MKLSIDWNNIMSSLGLLWQGMLAIFVSFIIIFLVILLMNYIDKAKQDRVNNPEKYIKKKFVFKITKNKNNLK